MCHTPHKSWIKGISGWFINPNNTAYSAFSWGVVKRGVYNKYLEATFRASYQV